jgi:nicotinamidase/pyrazinamidase
MLRYDDKTALIVVDVQNDFADPAGSLAVARADSLVPIIDNEMDMAAGQGALVVLTQDWHPEVTPHFKKDGGIWPVHCVADTWGAQLHAGLTPPAHAAQVRKGANGEDGYSGFTMRDPVSGETVPTELEKLLHDAGITNVVVCGLATDYCVKATALDAARLGFDTAVLSDAIAAVNLEPNDGAHALDEMREGGVTMWRTVTR